MADRLYAAALRRIEADGFESTSVASVTREAGVAKGTFFNHFPTKEHLLARVLDELIDGALEDPGGERRALQSQTDEEVRRSQDHPRETISSGLDLSPGLDRLAGELARTPTLARAIVPRLGFLPAAPGRPAAEDGRTGSAPTGLERVRRWIRDQLGEAARTRPRTLEVDDQTLSVLILSVFEATLREWVVTAGGEPPFPRGLLRGRIECLLKPAGFPSPGDARMDGRDRARDGARIEPGTGPG